MTLRTINLRPNGQITLPADIRNALGLKVGDTLLAERQGGTKSCSSPLTTP